MPEAPAPAGQRVALPGRGTTFVRDTGGGSPGSPPLVLLHGWTATAAINWVNCFSPLSQDFRVLALDHRGHGRGIRVNPVRGFRLEDCADDVIALLDALGIDRAIPVGYSMGGPIAQLTWKRHPDRVAGLTLCATSRNFRGTPQPALTQLALVSGAAGAAAAIRAIPAPVRRRAANAGVAWRRRALGFPEWAIEEIGRNDPAALLDGFRALQRFSSAEWIGEVDVPTAVVVTALDRLVPPDRQRKLAASIPGASVWEVRGDHDVCVAGPRRFPAVLQDACRWVAANARDRSRTVV